MGHGSGCVRRRVRERRRAARIGNDDDNCQGNDDASPRDACFDLHLGLDACSADAAFRRKPRVRTLVQSSPRLARVPLRRDIDFRDCGRLSQQWPLHDPCNPSMSSARFAGSTTCEYPAQVLRPGQVVVSWSDGAMPGGPSVPHPNTTISDEPAEVTTAHPGDCGQHGGQETITAALRIDHDHAFDMMACLRAPNLARDDTLVRQMIASAHLG